MRTPIDEIELYDGALKAHRAASFVKDGFYIEVVRPGYDSQGRRRNSWTQFSHEGIPIYEVRTQMPMRDAITRFDELWDDYFAANPGLLTDALEGVKRERRRAFKAKYSGVPPAPAATQDPKLHLDYGS